MTIVLNGDSQSAWVAGWGVDPWNVWGGQLAMLAGRGVANFATSGETSRQNLDRTGRLLDVPEAWAYGIAPGVNDPGAGISSAVTTRNMRSTLLALKHGARGLTPGVSVSVATEASLPEGAQSGTRLVVEVDGSTTGGVPAAHDGQAARIAGAVSGPAVWEARYPIAGVHGWGRVAVSGTPSSVRTFVVGAPYLNWTAGGDTLTTPDPTRAAIRGAQQDAATAEGALFVDVYAFMRQRIVDGVDPNFASVAYSQARSWHAVENNQHFSAYGHSLVALAVFARMKLAGWL